MDSEKVKDFFHKNIVLILSGIAVVVSIVSIGFALWSKFDYDIKYRALVSEYSSIMQTVDQRTLVETEFDFIEGKRPFVPVNDYITNYFAWRVEQLEKESYILKNNQIELIRWTTELQDRIVWVPKMVQETGGYVHVINSDVVPWFLGSKTRSHLHTTAQKPDTLSSKPVPEPKIDLTKNIMAAIYNHNHDRVIFNIFPRRKIRCTQEVVKAIMYDYKVRETVLNDSGCSISNPDSLIKLLIKDNKARYRKIGNQQQTQPEQNQPPTPKPSTTKTPIPQASTTKKLTPQASTISLQISRPSTIKTSTPKTPIPQASAISISMAGPSTVNINSFTSCRSNFSNNWIKVKQDIFAQLIKSKHIKSKKMCGRNNHALPLSCKIRNSA